MELLHEPGELHELWNLPKPCNFSNISKKRNVIAAKLMRNQS